MADFNKYIAGFNDWLNSLSDIRKYGLLAIIAGIILLIIAIILW